MSKRDKKTATSEAAPARQDGSADELEIESAADESEEPGALEPAPAPDPAAAAPSGREDPSADLVRAVVEVVLSRVDDLLQPLRERLDAAASPAPPPPEPDQPRDELVLDGDPGAPGTREDPVPGEVERAREAHARLERGEAFEVGAGVYRYLAKRPKHLSGGFGRRPSVVLPAAPEGCRWVGVVGSARGGRGAGAVAGTVVTARGHVVAELELAGSAATEIDLLLFTAPALPGAAQSR